mgnify:CR=1 FL=1
MGYEANHTKGGAVYRKEISTVMGCVVLLVWLAVVVGIAWVTIHFIVKFW